MAATSRHYGDVYKWIEKVIDSCDHPMQEVTAKRLVNRFNESLRDNHEVPSLVRMQMITELRNRIDDRRIYRSEKKLIKG